MRSTLETCRLSLNFRISCLAAPAFLSLVFILTGCQSPEPARHPSRKKVALLDLFDDSEYPLAKKLSSIPAPDKNIISADSEDINELIRAIPGTANVKLEYVGDAYTSPRKTVRSVKKGFSSMKRAGYASFLDFIDSFAYCLDLGYLLTSTGRTVQISFYNGYDRANIKNFGVLILPVNSKFQDALGLGGSGTLNCVSFFETLGIPFPAECGAIASFDASEHKLILRNFPRLRRRAQMYLRNQNMLAE